MAYRNLSSGSSQSFNVMVYGYSFALDPAKTVKSIALPSNSNGWGGGISPYQVQMATNLTQTDWIKLGTSLSTNAILIAPSNAEAFYRILRQ